MKGRRVSFFVRSGSALLAVLSCALLSPAAHAGFVVDGEGAASAPAGKATSQLRVSVKGDPRGLSLARGMGRDVPAAEAIVQIVPEGFETAFDDVDAQLKRKVTWRGGSEWTNVLSETLAQVGLIAEVDLAARTVRVAAPGAKPKASDKDKPKAAPKLTVRVADKSIRGMLSRWATDAGWQLSWEAPYDYPVPADKDLSMTFEEGVQMVMEGLSGAERPVQAIFYDANRVVRIVPFGSARKGAAK